VGGKQVLQLDDIVQPENNISLQAALRQKAKELSAPSAWWKRMQGAGGVAPHGHELDYPGGASATMALTALCSAHRPRYPPTQAPVYAEPFSATTAQPTSATWKSPRSCGLSAASARLHNSAALISATVAAY
jgi:hypothetical protein